MTHTRKTITTTMLSSLVLFLNIGKIATPNATVVTTSA
jgi:hypothetical protein